MWIYNDKPHDTFPFFFSPEKSIFCLILDKEKPSLSVYLALSFSLD